VDSDLNQKRLNAEDRAIALSKELTNIKTGALQVAIIAREVGMLRRRPADAAKGLIWDAKVRALNNTKALGRQTLLRIKTIQAEISALVANARAIASKEDGTVCGSIVSALNSLADALNSAVASLVTWVEANKCSLITLAFAVAGYLGDAVLSAVAPPIAAVEAVAQLQPWCWTTPIPGAGNVGNLAKMGLTVIKEVVCKTSDTFGVKTDVITAICADLDVSFDVIDILLKLSCGTPVTAIASIVSAAVQCSSGCSNSFCPSRNPGALSLQNVDSAYDTKMSVQQLADKMVQDAYIIAATQVSLAKRVSL